MKRNAARDEALSSGALRYFTGKPCSRGHLSERFVRNYECVACKALADAAYRAQNKDEITNKTAKWRSANHELVKGYANAYYARNKDKCHAAANKWTRENPERVKAAIAANSKARRASAKKYRRANPHIVRAEAGRRNAALLKAIPKWANLEMIKEIYKIAANQGMEVDHIIPLRGDTVCGLHVENNLQLLSAYDNQSKGNRLLDDERLAKITPIEVSLGFA